MEKQDILSRDFAQKRAKMVSDVSYKIGIWLEKNSKKYSGRCEINFSLRVLDDLKIEFIGNVKTLSVNGREGEFKKENFAVIVPKKSLKKGKNVIAIGYENEYDKTGTGLHNFVDPEDGKEYIYTQFEPYDAHRFFPCFDQPDIKATYKLVVNAPKEWIIISNTIEEKTEEKEKRKITTFKEAPKFSPYLFHISAGEFHQFKDKFNKIPLRIFCRQSMTKYFSEEMFTFTKQGLEFYQKFFNYPYPFEKYDQIFVPEFNHGAMENVGAVTFSERFLFRYEPRRTERLGLADVVLHEMAHMWFGDLVTMKWWDDLWLNESFADFLSYLGLVRATEFKEGWQSFYARKAWAYVEDQWITTHPIAADAADTDAAFSNFDGISYSKGAAALKQLMFFIGEEAFKKGLSAYFKKYQWKNTNLKDFMGCMELASGKKLGAWVKMWIKTTGVNTIEPLIKSKGGKIDSLSVRQQPSKNNNLLREHRSKAAFFCGGEKLKDIPIHYKGKLTAIKGVAGLEGVDFVLLNYDDHDYVKELLEKNSVDYLIESIDQITEGLARQMAYGALWQMVRDALIDPKKYLKLIIRKSPGEKDLLILESLFNRSAAILEAYLDDKDYYLYSEKLYELAWENLQKDIGRERKDVWFYLLATAASGCKSLGNMVGLLEGKIKIKDFVFNQEQRWASIGRLAIVGDRRVDGLIEKELEKDPSDKGRKEAFSAIVAKDEKKGEHWNLFVEGEKYSLDYLRIGMRNFFSRRQKESMRVYIDMFFDIIQNIFEDKNRKYAEDFFGILFPDVYVEQGFLKKCKNFLKNNPKMPLLLKESLLESADELERSLRILEKYSKSN